MKVITKLPKEVIDFYEQNATILCSPNSDNKYMFLPLWIGTHNDEEGEYEIIHLNSTMLNPELHRLINNYRSEEEELF